jgi:hypothetical protein
LSISTFSEIAALLQTPEAMLARLSKESDRLYGYMEIPRAGRAPRIIRPPHKQLRFVQRLLLDSLYQHVRMPRFVHGGVPGRSILSHARLHVSRQLVATFDVRDFFPTISSSKVRTVLGNLGFAGEALAAATRLTTFEDQIPQGAPTSPLLANLAFDEIDRRLYAMARRHGLHYSRYVDDVAMSGDADFIGMKGTIIDLIESGGFKTAPDKIHFMPSTNRQVVTGLVVNSRMKPTPEFVGDLKDLIYVAIESGVDAAAALEGVQPAQLKKRLNGRVSHVEQCDPEAGARLRQLLFGVPWRGRPTFA